MLKQVNKFIGLAFRRIFRNFWLTDGQTNRRQTARRAHWEIMLLIRIPLNCYLWTLAWIFFVLHCFNSYWKWNFPMNPHVLLSVEWLVCRSSFTWPAPIRAIDFYYSIVHTQYASPLLPRSHNTHCFIILAQSVVHSWLNMDLFNTGVLFFCTNSTH